jgi:hypothetical protein
MLTIKVTKEQFDALLKMNEHQITNVLLNYNVPPARLDHIEWNEHSVVIHDRCITTGGTVRDNSHEFVVAAKAEMPVIAAGIRVEWAEWAVNLNSKKNPLK